MIGNIVSHGRSARDARNLVSHLLKTEMNERVEVRVDNMLVGDLPSALRDMRLMRDSTKANAAFLHISISPSIQLSDKDLHRAGDIVLRHLGMADHGCARVLHNKPRVAGAGGTHLHLVVARVGPDRTVARAGLDKINVETACRLAEFELGKEKRTLGRHYRSSLRYLEKFRPEVAAWLAAGLGPQPELPRGTVTPDHRRVLERNGVDFRETREVVREAWARSDGPQALCASLLDQGLSVIAGDKTGVWIVQRNGEFLGALDRLAKVARAEVAAFMKKPYEPARVSDPRVGQDNLSPNKFDGVHREPHAPPGPVLVGNAPAGLPRGAGRVTSPYDAGPHIQNPLISMRDAAPHRRSGRSSRTAPVESARADLRRLTHDLRAAAPRIPAQASQDYADAMRELDRRATAVRARIADAVSVIELPSSLVDASDRAVAAREALMKAEGREAGARATLEAAKATRPSGPIAWITGTGIAADHQIQLLERSLRAAVMDVEARRIVSAGADKREILEVRAHAVVEAEHRRRQCELQELGRRDLAWVDRLRDMLEAQPTWAARGVDALSRHMKRANTARVARNAESWDEEHRGPQVDFQDYRPLGPAS